jgi:hypothetical protein
LLLPGAASAGCGDDLVVHRSEAAAPQLADHHNPLSGTDRHPGRPCDCKGPSCSRAPLTPAPTKPAPPSSADQDFALPVAATPGTNEANSSSAVYAHLSQPFFATLDIYHPPR